MKKYKMHISFFGITALFCFGSICALLTGNFISFLKNLVMTAIVFVINYILYQSTYLKIDDTKLEGKTGIFKIEKLSCKIDKITSVKITQNIFEKILNTGTIVIQTPTGIFHFGNMNNPEEIKNKLLK